MNTNLEKIKNTLVGREIKPTYQRLRIFDYLMKNKTHPTAEMIYKDLVGEIPTISKTTVYNTLDILMKKGLVISVLISGTEVRFDANTSWHHHFFCQRCNKIIDIDTECKYTKKGKVKGHKITQVQGCFKGICKSCLERER